MQDSGHSWHAEFARWSFISHMTCLEPEVGVSCARRFLEDLLQGPELLVERHVHRLPIRVQGILRTSGSCLSDAAVKQS